MQVIERLRGWGCPQVAKRRAADISVANTLCGHQQHGWVQSPPWWSSMAKAMGINRIECQSNSESVVQNCTVTRDTLDPNMKA
jgi:hypothetical protein